jgi:hypothetical protein
MTKKAETAAQRKRRGAANPERTQDARDRMAFYRYARKHPSEVLEWARSIIAREDEVTDEDDDPCEMPADVRARARAA